VPLQHAKTTRQRYATVSGVTCILPYPPEDAQTPGSLTLVIRTSKQRKIPDLGDEHHDGGTQYHAGSCIQPDMLTALPALLA